MAQSEVLTIVFIIINLTSIIEIKLYVSKNTLYGTVKSAIDFSAGMQETIHNIRIKRFFVIKL